MFGIYPSLMCVVAWFLVARARDGAKMGLEVGTGQDDFSARLVLALILGSCASTYAIENVQIFFV